MDPDLECIYTLSTFIREGKFRSSRKKLLKKNKINLLSFFCSYKSYISENGVESTGEAIKMVLEDKVDLVLGHPSSRGKSQC